LNINTVTLTGNLTRDPELKTFGETTVCKLRIAVNERVKQNGEWGNNAMYFDVDVFGAQGERCAQYLVKGAHIVLEGRLKWREWTTDDGGKRQAVSIVARDVEFPSKKESEGMNPNGTYGAPASNAAAPQPSGGTTGFGGSSDDDDIPF
jgi:single-strand DNA-binding protein